MAIDLREEKMVKDFLENKNSENDDDFEKDFKKKSSQKKMSQKEIDHEFDDLDISKFNTK